MVKNTFTIPALKFGALLKGTWKVFKKLWPVLTGLALLNVGLQFSITSFVFFKFSSLTSLITVPIWLFLYSYQFVIIYKLAGDVCHGRKISWPNVLRVSIRKWPVFVGVHILTGLFIAVGYIALIIPGIIMTFDYLLTSPVILDEKKPKFLDPSRNSWEHSTKLMHGIKWKIFGYLLLYTLLWIVIHLVLSPMYVSLVRYYPHTLLLSANFVNMLLYLCTPIVLTLIYVYRKEEFAKQNTSAKEKKEQLTVQSN